MANEVHALQGEGHPYWPFFKQWFGLQKYIIPAAPYWHVHITLIVSEVEKKDCGKQCEDRQFEENEVKTNNFNLQGNQR